MAGGVDNTKESFDLMTTDIVVQVRNLDSTEPARETSLLNHTFRPDPEHPGHFIWTTCPAHLKKAFDWGLVASNPLHQKSDALTTRILAHLAYPLARIQRAIKGGIISSKDAKKMRIYKNCVARIEALQEKERLLNSPLFEQERLKLGLGDINTFDKLRRHIRSELYTVLFEAKLFNQNLVLEEGSLLGGDLDLFITHALDELPKYEYDQNNPILPEHQGIFGSLQADTDELVEFHSVDFGLSPEAVECATTAIPFIEGKMELKTDLESPRLQEGASKKKRGQSYEEMQQSALEQEQARSADVQRPPTHAAPPSIKSLKLNETSATKYRSSGGFLRVTAKVLAGLVNIVVSGIVCGVLDSALFIVTAPFIGLYNVPRFFRNQKAEAEGQAKEAYVPIGKFARLSHFFRINIRPLRAAGKGSEPFIVEKMHAAIVPIGKFARLSHFFRINIRPLRAAGKGSEPFIVEKMHAAIHVEKPSPVEQVGRFLGHYVGKYLFAGTLLGVWDVIVKRVPKAFLSMALDWNQAWQPAPQKAAIGALIPKQAESRRGSRASQIDEPHRSSMVSLDLHSEIDFSISSATRVSPPTPLTPYRSNDIVNLSVSGLCNFSEFFLLHLYDDKPFVAAIFTAAYAAGGLSIMAPTLAKHLFGQGYVEFSQGLGAFIAKGNLGAAVTVGFTEGKVAAGLFELLQHGPRSWAVKGVEIFQKDPLVMAGYTLAGIGLGYLIMNIVEIPFISEHLREDAGSVWEVAAAFAALKLGLVALHLLSAEDELAIREEEGPEFNQKIETLRANPVFMMAASALCAEHFGLAEQAKKPSRNALFKALQNKWQGEQNKMKLMVFFENQLLEHQDEAKQKELKTVLAGLKRKLYPEPSLSPIRETLNILAKWALFPLRLLASALGSVFMTIASLFSKNGARWIAVGRPWKALPFEASRDLTRVADAFSKLARLVVRIVICPFKTTEAIFSRGVAIIEAKWINPFRSAHKSMYADWRFKWVSRLTIAFDAFEDKVGAATIRKLHQKHSVTQPQTALQSLLNIPQAPDSAEAAREVQGRGGDHSGSGAAAGERPCAQSAAVTDTSAASTAFSSSEGGRPGIGNPHDARRQKRAQLPDSIMTGNPYALAASERSRDLEAKRQEAGPVILVPASGSRGDDADAVQGRSGSGLEGGDSLRRAAAPIVSKPLGQGTTTASRRHRVERLGAGAPASASSVSAQFSSNPFANVCLGPASVGVHSADTAGRMPVGAPVLAGSGYAVAGTLHLGAPLPGFVPDASADRESGSRTRFGSA